MNHSPVGVFDSGLGGLSVAREIRALLPAEHLLYLADSAHCPYGGRPPAEIRALSVAAGRLLTERGAKALVVACNTASGVALEALREALPIPVVGLEPAVKPAAALTRRGRVGVMATAATLRSDRFARLLQQYAGGVTVVPQACPGLADLVESGVVEGPAARRAVEPFLAPLRDAGVDVVVLGCTHYPFLRDAVAEGMGPDVEILDSGHAVAAQLRRVLGQGEALAGEGHGGIRVLTTGEPSVVGPVARRLLGEAAGVDHVELDYSPPQLRSSGSPPPAGSAT